MLAIHSAPRRVIGRSLASAPGLRPCCWATTSAPGARLSSSAASPSASPSPSPHPALTILPDFLSKDEQHLLLRHSLRLLDAPARSTAASRKRRREWLRRNPDWSGPGGSGEGFLGEEAYSWEEGHFDGVIRRYREMLVREGMWDLPQPSPSSSPAGEGTQPETEQLDAALQKVYALLPPPSQDPNTSPSSASSLSASPPPHLILHLLHLSSAGAIFPHVDNLDAFGHTIVGISLGGERIMHFKRTEDTAEEAAVADPEAGPSEFEVLLEPGSAYIQREPLRTYYTHEVLEGGGWDGRPVGGTQRLSIMLRDRLPTYQA